MKTPILFFLIFSCFLSCNKQDSTSSSNRASLHLNVNGQDYDYSLDASALNYDGTYLRIIGWKVESSGNRSQFYTMIHNPDGFRPVTYQEASSGFPLITMARDIELSPGVFVKAIDYQGSPNLVKITITEIDVRHVKGNFEGSLMVLDQSGNSSGNWQSTTGNFEIDF